MQRETPPVSCKVAWEVLSGSTSVGLSFIYLFVFYVSLYYLGFVSCRPGGHVWELISSYEGGGMIDMSGSWLALPLRVMGEPYADLGNSTCAGTYGGQRPLPFYDLLVCFPTMDARAEEMYVEFKNALPNFLLVFGGLVVFGKVAQARCGIKGRVWFDVIFAAFLITFAHGVIGSLILWVMAFGISALSIIARRWSLGTAQVSVWIFSLVCMEAVFRMLGDHAHVVEGWHKDQGFKFWSRLESVICGDELLSQPMENGQLCWLSKAFVVKGNAPWLIFRFTGLRFVSYALDRLWCFHEVPSGVRDISTKPELVQRTEVHLEPEKYGPKYFIAYLGYAPLFGAGPFLSYNAFVSQMEHPQQVYSRSSIFWYGFQLTICMVLFEIFSVAWWYSQKLNQLTCDPGGLYPRCIFDDLPLWELYLGMHVRLHFSWMSLLIVWRFTRLIGLLDGIDSPENMLDCASFQYSFEDFWRIWHASMNRFMLRYLYNPLGGKRRTWLAVPTVFLFVAYWHESTGFWTQRFWYAWAFLNAVGVTLEKAVSNTVGKKIKARAGKGNLLAQGLCFISRGIVPFFVILANVPPLYAENTVHFYRSLLLRGWESVAVVLAIVFAWACCNYLVISMRTAASSLLSDVKQPLKQGGLEASSSQHEGKRETELPASFTEHT